MTDSTTYKDKYRVNDKYTLTPAGGAYPNLFRVRLLRDIYVPQHGYYIIRAGTVGGLVEGEHNLSTDGNSWIHDNAIVHGPAFIAGDAQVMDYAEISGRTLLKDDSLVRGTAKINGTVKMLEHASVWGGFLTGKVNLSGNAKILDCAELDGGDVGIYLGGNSVVGGRAKISGAVLMNYIAKVDGTAVIKGSTSLDNPVILTGSAHVTGNKIIDRSANADTLTLDEGLISS